MIIRCNHKLHSFLVAREKYQAQWILYRQLLYRVNEILSMLGTQQ